MRWFALLVLLATAPAFADDAKAPWVVGVSDEHKAAAKKLLDEGNTLFVEHDYAKALELYREAVAQWDHPAIRFNIVRCLIQLDRPVEAAENLEVALKYGSAPLEEQVYAEAIAYQKLLANQTAEIEVECKQQGVEVSLDGQLVVHCPGRETRRVSPGRHVVVGTKRGFMTRSDDVAVGGGTHQLVGMTLAPIETSGVVVHRWSGWVPWVVFGGGLAVVGAGALVEGIASAKMNDYDRALARDCAAAGCNPVPPADQAIEDSAHTYNTIGTTVIVAGVATAVVGGVLLYLNRGRIVYRNVEAGPARVALHF